MQRILPPILKKTFQQARTSSANFFLRKLAGKCSILCGESMRSKLLGKDLKDNSFHWFRVKLEALRKCVELSNGNFVP